MGQPKARRQMWDGFQNPYQNKPNVTSSLCSLQVCRDEGCVSDQSSRKPRQLFASMSLSFPCSAVGKARVSLSLGCLSPTQGPGLS